MVIKSYAYWALTHLHTQIIEIHTCSEEEYSQHQIAQRLDDNGNVANTTQEHLSEIHIDANEIKPNRVCTECSISLGAGCSGSGTSYYLVSPLCDWSQYVHKFTDHKRQWENTERKISSILVKWKF